MGNMQHIVIMLAFVLLCYVCSLQLLHTVSNAADTIEIDAFNQKFKNHRNGYDRNNNKETRNDNAQTYTKDTTESTSNSSMKHNERLNILLLYADDWRHDTLSSAGNPIIQTPNLDNLAKQGIRFTHK